LFLQVSDIFSESVSDICLIPFDLIALCQSSHSVGQSYRRELFIKRPKRGREYNRNMASVPAPTAPVSPRRVRISPVKTLAVVFGLVVLTPFWIFHGLVGALLTTPSKSISQRGVFLLALLASAILAEVGYVQLSHGELAQKALDTELFATLIAIVGALLYAQSMFHDLIRVVIDQPNETEAALGRVTAVIAPLCLVYALWAPASTWKHWELITGLSTCTCSSVARGVVV